MIRSQNATRAQLGRSQNEIMSVLYIAVPLALVVALIAVIAFVIQVRTGQYDDLETPAHRMLFDDEPAASEKLADKGQANEKNEVH